MKNAVNSRPCASGWRAIPAINALPAMPSPMPAPIAPPAMIKPPPMSAPWAATGSNAAIYFPPCWLVADLPGFGSNSVGLVVFIVEFHRLAEVQDCQQREDERLDRTDEQIEAIPHGVGQPEYPRRKQCDQGDEDAAGEDVAEKPERQRDRLGQFLD